MLQFTPLSGAYDADPDGASGERPKALAYLLEMDGCCILLDCGAPEDLSFDAAPVKSERDGLHGTLPEILERYVGFLTQHWR